MAALNPQSGPAPVAQMYDDTMDVDGDDSPGGDGNTDSDEWLSVDASETESWLSVDTSETESSDEEPHCQVDWRKVGVDYLLTRQALDAFGQRKPRPPTPPTPPGKPSRPRVNPPPARTPLSGDKTFVQWIPYWGDPGWNDVHYTFDKDGAEVAVADVPPLDKQRPALLPKDALKDPTHYAKRFGIHADRSDGRSRMSPTTSTTRRAQLRRAQETPTGTKDYLTFQDADKILRDADPSLTSAETIGSLLTDNHGDTEHIEAYLRLRDMLEEDKAWQRAAFHDITTDERVAHGVHSDDPTPLTYDLAGSLHPLLVRERWLTPESRGDSEENARLHYNLYGNRGEWCAQNDQVWEVLQPALQLVGRFIRTDHPYVTALLDPKSRRYIDSSRLVNGPHGKNWLSFTLDFDRARRSTAMDPDLKQPGADAIAVLDGYHFDLPRAAARFLSDRLRLQLFSSNEAWRKGDTFRAEHVTWGRTEAFASDDPEGAGITISLGAEMLWPLLIPEFTPKEKASCTTMMAFTLLHELAHAANFALEAILSLAFLEHHDQSSPLHGVPEAVLLGLRNLSAVLPEEDEPYFEEEQVPEVGFAFENAVFGGTVDSGFSGFGVMYNHSVMLPMALQLQPWPWARPRPHVKESTVLKDPPLPVDTVSTLLPSETYTRFFSQAFWDVEYAKYGVRTLKMHPDNGALTRLDRQFWRRKDLVDVFGRSHAGWLMEALPVLNELGHALLSAYCNQIISEKMEVVWVRKRFHHERKVWPVRIKAFHKILDKTLAHISQLSVAWATLHLTGSDKTKDIDTHNLRYHEACLKNAQPPGGMLDWEKYHAQLQEQLVRLFTGLVGSTRELHHHLLHEIRCIQTLVVDYVQQTPSDRERLHSHYIGHLYRQIEEGYEPVIQDLLTSLEQIRAKFERAGALSDEMNDDIQRTHNFLQLDLNHLVRTKFFLSDDNVVVEGLSWEGELETIPRGRAKKKCETMKRMATKELLRAPPVIRQLVDKILDIVDVNKDEARKEEAALTRKGIMNRMKRHMRVSEPRKREGLNGGRHPFWLLPTPSTTTPEPTAAFARPVGTTVQPWKAAPTPPPQARGLRFGKPNDLAVATPPITPLEEPNFAARYASTPISFPKVPEGQSVLRPSSPKSVEREVPAFDMESDVSFGGVPRRPGWGPFGTAWCDSRTLSEELQEEGVRTPGIRSVFGER